MVWDAESANKLQVLSGCYALPGNCWAVLTIHHAPAKDAVMAAAVPEGYDYKWVVLAPGEPPKLRGHRMAGLDNSNDGNVRRQIQAHPEQGTHWAHRHYPNWKEVIHVRGDVWPVANSGEQLSAPPENPGQFWRLCMTCLSDTLDSLGLDMPAEADLFARHMTEKSFRAMQRGLTGRRNPATSHNVPPAGR